MMIEKEVIRECFMCAGHTPGNQVERIQITEDYPNYADDSINIYFCCECWSRSTDDSTPKNFLASEWIDFAGSEYEPWFDAKSIQVYYPQKRKSEISVPAFAPWYR